MGVRGRGVTKKRSKKRKETFSVHIFKVLKQVHPEVSISSKAMSIVNSMVNDIFDKMSNEAITINTHLKKNTLTARDIQTSVRLIFPGELAKHAVSEGTKAVNKYISTMPAASP